MGVLLQGFYKLANNRAVPSPSDGDPTIPQWWDHLAEQANAFGLTGFTAVWLPPVLKTGNGSAPSADGYGPFDDYDIGSRKQKGSIATRFGTRTQLQRCVAMLRANGIDVYLDMVEHHRSGDDGAKPFVFRYPGANGTPLAGRFPKDPGNFLPQVPRDPDLGGPPSDDFPFGRELAPINARPHRYVFDNLIAASDWLTRALDVQGYRVDDVKGLSTDFLLPFLNSRSMAGKFAVGEFFDGNRLLVNGWIFNPKGMQGRPSAFDFPLKFLLNGMCNNPGRFNMADLDHAGLIGISPQNAVTFVENHDTDLQPGTKITTNKLMGYAYILTSEGYPSVFYRDYSTDPNCYELKLKIDNLIWIHEALANGPTQQRWKDFDVFAYERMAGAHLLVGLNNDPGTSRTVHVDTGFGGNVDLHDYSGHGPDVRTDGGGAVTITIPQNINGLGYVCYSRAGQDHPLPTRSHAVTQDIEGAEDLDVLPIIDGQVISAGEIWCAAHSKVSAALTLDRKGWSPATKVELSLVFPDGSKTVQAIDSASPAVPLLQATANEVGFYQLQITAANLPVSPNGLAYRISVTYTAPTTMPKPARAVVAQAAAQAAMGRWSDAFALDNVAIHAHLLPTGKVLYWGRRDEVGSPSFPTLNEHHCTTFLWDPKTGSKTKTSNQPTLEDGTGVNLFCSGHSFLSDGRLAVIGGHLFDSLGVNQSCTYNPFTDQWLPTKVNPGDKGRWYPSALTLPDGGFLVLSGSFALGVPAPPPNNKSAINQNPQVWRGNGWESLTDFDTLTLFPRFHVAPDGRVFMTGGLGATFFLDIRNGGTWIQMGERKAGLRDYAPSVMYDTGKIAFIGGGLDQGLQTPTNEVEIIDLTDAAPSWRDTSPMNFARRQHNAVILPDGTIFVSGGTRGNGFNDLDDGAPVHTPEIWNPVTGKWTIMADEAFDRCYHATALLLPDGRVLSAGGGEYAPNVALPVANPAKDSHANAQLFSPPYLFAGPAPVIAPGAAAEVLYGGTFDVTVDQAADIQKVSWIRLGSVTHSFDQNQRLNFLSFVKAAGKLTITAPLNANLCPPGHYMLFVLNARGVPSVGHIMRISAPVVAAAVQVPMHNALFSVVKPGPVEKDAVIVKNATRPPVTVGVTPKCPYGLAACWGGARDALQRLTGVETVLHVANSFDSTADLYLKDDTLPDLDQWRQEFAGIANASYVLRGIEMTLRGTIREVNGLLTLVDAGGRPPVLLAPIDQADKVQYDFGAQQPRLLLPAEEAAYGGLKAAASQASAVTDFNVTGPLLHDEGGFFMEVRRFA